MEELGCLEKIAENENYWKDKMTSFVDGYETAKSGKLPENI